MKKYLLRIVALFAVFAIVGYFIYDYSQREYWVIVEEAFPSLDGVTLDLDRETYDKKSFIAVYTMTNGTENDICWGADLGGRVEQWAEDGWRFRETRSRKGMEYPAVEYTIRSGETKKEEISLRAALPRLTPGRYRYARYYDLGGSGQQYASYCEFMIK